MWRPYELDGRPSDNHRSNLYMMMQRCIHCGYCAQDIADGPDTSRGSVASDRYRAQLADRSWPDTVTAYLCSSFISEDAGDLAGAGAWAKFASWVCDDDRLLGDKGLACRRRAVDLLRRARTAGMSFAPNAVGELLLLMDLERRCGNLLAVEELAREAQLVSTGETDRAIVQFQLELVEDGDTGRHTLAEALEG